MKTTRKSKKRTKKRTTQTKKNKKKTKKQKDTIDGTIYNFVFYILKKTFLLFHTHTFRHWLLAQRNIAK
jgi:hypothetical protein